MYNNRFRYIIFIVCIGRTSLSDYSCKGASLCHFLIILYLFSYKLVTIFVGSYNCFDWMVLSARYGLKIACFSLWIEYFNSGLRGFARGYVTSVESCSRTKLFFTVRTWFCL